MASNPGRLLAMRRGQITIALKWLLAVSTALVGVLHFTNPQPFLDIMPPYLPYHLELVYISGFFEIVGSIGLLVPMTQRAAAWGLIALFVAVYPANIHLAVNNPPMNGEIVPAWIRWGRLPVQFVFIYWAWIFTRNKTQTDDSESAATQ